MTRAGRPRARAVASMTLVLFLAVFALLAFQLRSGRDPALGRPQARAAAPAPPPRRVLVRKIIVTRVVVHLPARDDDRPVAAAAPVRVPVPSSPPAVAAPPAAAPAPAPAAPAPAAPPPLTTRSS